MRISECNRKTTETDIRLTINLDGSGESTISTGCGFLDHMLTLFAHHGNFDVAIACAGDTYVDDHHTVEDIGICLGTAFSKALGNKCGIRRYGHILLPMDEALLLCAADLSGRSFLSCELQIPSEKVGTFDTELTEEFFLAFVRAANVTLHIKQLSGKNSHHIIEGSFKAFARVLAQAVRIDEEHKDDIPSTKGVLI
ncbi:imidazoleglycerol-phosphate dehydratase HisB [Aminipila luticellarii]|uniref:Imidazoleglycerol-phosphate dehydratase n=1 Tax=Aminipila luticellarii TaxID=2507160 RepID=A0A410PWE0_9FIRM|nr:imidazoleglycerol-phosphate dehydratase HisB [Aminipila luticellarii]QAT43235.1 imidazoleglycerol-phosphate dehydratase HisB [Aminipila luticellarii]